MSAEVNPYKSHDDDADILGDANGSDTEVRWEIRGPNGEELPPELQEALKDYVGGMAEAGASLPVAFKAVRGMYEFFANFRMFQDDGPLLLAVAEVLNEMSKGRVHDIWRIHECEREIMYSTTISNFLNRILSSISPEDEYGNEIIFYFETAAEIAVFVRKYATDNYISLCDEAGLTPDPGLIEEGIYSKTNDFLKVALGNPFASDED